MQPRPKDGPAVSNQPTFTVSAGRPDPLLQHPAHIPPGRHRCVQRDFQRVSDARADRDGTLPAGLTFVDNPDGSATLEGDVTAAPGSYPIVVQASNGVGPVVTQVVPITVVPAGPPTLVLRETVNRSDDVPVPAGSSVTWNSCSPTWVAPPSPT